MKTYYAKLDAKALAKYDLIIAAMLESNYVIADQFRDGATSKDYWLFTKHGV